MFPIIATYMLRLLKLLLKLEYDRHRWLLYRMISLALLRRGAR